MKTPGQGNTLLVESNLPVLLQSNVYMFTVFPGQAVVGFMWDLDCEVSVTVGEETYR